VHSPRPREKKNTSTLWACAQRKRPKESPPVSVRTSLPPTSTSFTVLYVAGQPPPPVSDGWMMPHRLALRCTDGANTRLTLCPFADRRPQLPTHVGHQCQPTHAWVGPTCRRATQSARAQASSFVSSRARKTTSQSYRALRICKRVITVEGRQNKHEVLLGGSYRIFCLLKHL
jgi:hypothetical protein